MMLKLQTKALQDLIKVSLVWSDYTVPKIQLCRLKDFDIINIKISLSLHHCFNPNCVGGW